MGTSCLIGHSPTLKSTRPGRTLRIAVRRTLIYIDGPVHQMVVRETNDVEMDHRLASAGYTVVRFSPTDSSWDRIVKEYTWVFGPGISPSGY